MGASKGRRRSMEDEKMEGREGKKKGSKDEEERAGEEGRQRERQREQRDREGERQREREGAERDREGETHPPPTHTEFPFCGLFLIFAVFFVSLAQLCPCNYSQ